MSNDNFSQKEILLQLMSKVDNLNVSVNNQQLLLNTIHDASAGRDEKIRDLKEQVITLEDEVKILTEKVEGLKSFNKTIVAIWSGCILLLSMFSKYIIERVF